MLRWQRGLLVPTNYAKDILGNLSRDIPLAWCTMTPPTPPRHVSKRSAASVIRTRTLLFLVAEFKESVDFQS